MRSASAYPPRVVIEGVERPDISARLQAAEGYEIDLDEVEDTNEAALWCVFFREGNAQMDLCGVCGRPQGIFIPLRDWVDAPLVCRHCTRNSTDGL